MTSSKGLAIVFRYEAADDVVIAQPRGTLDKAVDVTRWYQSAVAYLSGRFNGRKDLIAINGGDFAIAPRLGTLWGQYLALLLQARVRTYVGVGSSDRVTLATNTSASLHGLQAFERRTLEEALDLIRAQRQRDTLEMPAPRISDVRRTLVYPGFGRVDGAKEPTRRRDG